VYSPSSSGYTWWICKRAVAPSNSTLKSPPKGNSCQQNTHKQVTTAPATLHSHAYKPLLRLQIRQLERDVEVATVPELSTAKASEMLSCAFCNKAQSKHSSLPLDVIQKLCANYDQFPSTQTNETFKTALHNVDGKCRWLTRQTDRARLALS
jgi:hypothetical protein